jgi:hypothetical protein
MDKYCLSAEVRRMIVRASSILISVPQFSIRLLLQSTDKQIYNAMTELLPSSYTQTVVWTLFCFGHRMTCAFYMLEKLIS